MWGLGCSWFDIGTYDSLIDAGKFLKTIEYRQGYKIAYLEEIVFKYGWLSKGELIEKGEKLSGTRYGQYLLETTRSSHI